MNKAIIWLVLFYVTQAQASLINRGNGLIYDSIQDLTWIQDPLASIDIAKHRSQGGSGSSLIVTLQENGNTNFGDRAVISNLKGLNYLGFNDWRRAKTVGNTPAETTGTIVNGELANLFRDNDTSIFTGVTNKKFWAGNQQFADPAHGVFSNNGVLQFDTGRMAQIMVNRQLSQDYGYVWAVRDGDVSPVPLTPALFLFVSALMPFFLLGSRFRKD